MGIRTPWTLSSEEVWNKTHRMGGKIFMLGGLILMFSGFYPVNARVLVLSADVLIIVIGTAVYSYVAFVKEKKHGKNN